jgi:cysteine desulfurase family protein (TIGR01976 family)
MTPADPQAPSDPQATSAPVDVIRSRFPGLHGPTILLENAGGSQVPTGVADAIRDYMLHSYVQLEAGYPESDAADAVVQGAHDFQNLLMNGSGHGQVVLGPSTSQLMAMLAACYEGVLQPGDEIVIPETGHEANVGPWVRLAERGGFTLRTWALDPERQDTTLEGLDEVLNDRTRLVAVVHVSNLLGSILDVKAVADRVHAANPAARLIVDGVAFAPHRAIDVAAWDADYYVYSTYKVYGPHMAALWGRSEAFAEISGPNHFFIRGDDVPYTFELGGVCHESCAGVLALGDYLRFLASIRNDRPRDDRPRDGRTPETCDRAVIEDAFHFMQELERPLIRRLLDYLASKPSVRVVGPADESDARVGTISFVHESKTSAEIVAAAHAHGVGIRNGHMYAYRLCEALGLEPDDGVVRVSLLHYNTLAEIERCIEAFETVL